MLADEGVSSPSQCSPGIHACVPRMGHLEGSLLWVIFFSWPIYLLPYWPGRLNMKPKGDSARGQGISVPAQCAVEYEIWGSSWSPLCSISFQVRTVTGSRTPCPVYGLLKAPVPHHQHILAPGRSHPSCPESRVSKSEMSPLLYKSLWILLTFYVLLCPSVKEL